MLHSEYYLGLPNEIWNSLLIETEELLSEEEIGTHILGVYPSGSRIFGIESSSPEFICLHMDCPESILNPSIVHHPDNETGYWSHTIRPDGSKITFIHLFDWVQWLIYRSTENPLRLIKMHDLIPCHQDIAYQDESINDLILMVREYIEKVPSPSFINSHSVCKTYEEKLEYALYMRLRLVMERTGKFLPNLNQNWGNVESVLEEGRVIYEIDKLIQETILGNKKIVSEENLDIYSKEIYKKIYNNRIVMNDKLAREISQETMKIYRYIL